MICVSNDDMQNHSFLFSLEPINQNSMKVCKVFKPTNKTLGTIIIYSQMASPLMAKLLLFILFQQIFSHYFNLCHASDIRTVGKSLYKSM